MSTPARSPATSRLQELFGPSPTTPPDSPLAKVARARYQELRDAAPRFKARSCKAIHTPPRAVTPNQGDTTSDSDPELATPQSSALLQHLRDALFSLLCRRPNYRSPRPRILTCDLRSA